MTDAIDFDGGVHVKALLRVLALIPIKSGAAAIVAPEDNLEVVMIKVWIFTILAGAALVCPFVAGADAGADQEAEKRSPSPSLARGSSCTTTPATSCCGSSRNRWPAI